MQLSLPERHKKYDWVVREFAKIKGIDIISCDEGPNHVRLWMTNRATGKNNKTFSFILKERIFMEFEGIPDDFLDYDLMDMADPTVFVNLALIKAEHLFSDKVLS